MTHSETYNIHTSHSFENNYCQIILLHSHEQGQFSKWANTPALIANEC